ncbi:ribosome silencing factor [Ilumatobacter sp.]|uniref:ribosome silencing factor n=1 Tax=Ilumatobacter sp. TaxID=1967498 RepID=UPI003AF4F12F
MIDREARELAVSAARFGDALKATDILVLHVGDVLAVTEYFVVMSGSNRRLVDALVDDVEARVREASGRSPVRVEGARENQWVLVDYGDVVVHVFLSEIREFYEIERLYTDVPKVDWAGDGSAGEPDGGTAEPIEPTGTD